MVKVGKVLTKEELLRENCRLEQKIVKLKIQIEMLKEIMKNRELNLLIRRALN